MHRSLYIILIISLLSLTLKAQENAQIETESRIFKQLFYEEINGAEVQIIQEEKLDEILMMFMEQNRNLEGIPCYWIRIYSGSAHDSRQEANNIKARFLRKYEDIRINVIYDDPNFKVYAGGYRSKSETLKLLNKIKRDFRTAFIVYDIIDFPEKPVDLQ
ncbi:SPOR domain-containing protein [Bacteroidota bacterium]